MKAFIVTVFDYTAIAISVFGLAGLFLLAVAGAARNVWQQILYSWGRTDERILLLVVAGSLGWCALRRRELNSENH